MLFCDHIVSIDDFKIFATSDSDFHVKVNRSLLISCDKPILNKTETHYLLTYLIDPFHMKLCLFRCLKSETIESKMLQDNNQ